MPVTENDNKTRRNEPESLSTLSRMTIPQLKNAQKILIAKRDKLKSEGNLDEFSKNKIERMLSRYVKAEYEINKYWKKTYNKQPGVTARNRNTLTLLEVYKNKGRGLNKLVKKEGANGYNALDMFNDVKGVALGVGVTAITIGAANQVANLFGTNVGTLLIEALKLLGPVNSSLILGGAALVVAAKVIPAIRRKADQMKRHRANAQDLQNELTDDMHKGFEGLDPTLLDGSHQEEIIQKLFNNYEELTENEDWIKEFSNVLNNSQRLYFKSALNEAEKKYDSYHKTMTGKTTLESAWDDLNKERATFETEKEQYRKDVAEADANREKLLSDAELEAKRITDEANEKAKNAEKNGQSRALKKAKADRDAETQRANNAEELAAKEVTRRKIAEAETEELKAKNKHLQEKLDKSNAAKKPVQQNDSDDKHVPNPKENEDLTKKFQDTILDGKQTFYGVPLEQISEPMKKIISDILNMPGTKNNLEAYKRSTTNFAEGTDKYQKKIKKVGIDRETFEKDSKILNELYSEIETIMVSENKNRDNPLTTKERLLKNIDQKLAEKDLTEEQRKQLEERKKEILGFAIEESQEKEV